MSIEWRKSNIWNVLDISIRDLVAQLVGHRQDLESGRTTKEIPNNVSNARRRKPQAEKGNNHDDQNDNDNDDEGSQALDNETLQVLKL